MANPDINNTKIIKTQNSGNGLTATSDIPPCSVIIKVSNPYLILLEKQKLQNLCSRCFIETGTLSCKSLKNCSACKAVYYCSSICQKADWGAIHKKECKLLQGWPGVPPTPTRGLIWLSLLHKHKNTLDPRLDGLVDNMEMIVKCGKERWEGIVLQATVAVKYTGRGDEWVPRLARVLCQMSMNAHRVTEPDGENIGLCFDPILSLVNHSCSPNATLTFDGRTAYLRALTQIKKGEEIFISYITTVESRSRRQQDLEERYHFKCECIRCKTNENEYATLLRLFPEPTSSSRRIKVLTDISDVGLKVRAESHCARYGQIMENPLEQQRWKRLVEDYHSGDNIIKALKHDRHLRSVLVTELLAIPPCPVLLRSLFLEYLDQEAWIPALVCLLNAVLHCDPINYPQPHHPQRIVELFVLARFITGTLTQMTLEELTASLSILPKAAADRIAKHLKDLDLFGGWQVLIGIMLEEVGKSHGEGTRFAQEVLEDSRTGMIPPEHGNSQMGKIDRWMRVDASYEEGRKEAKKAVQSLERLAGCLGDVIGTDEVHCLG